jgi:hypothetical protein
MNMMIDAHYRLPIRVPLLKGIDKTETRTELTHTVNVSATGASLA